MPRTEMNREPAERVTPEKKSPRKKKTDSARVLRNVVTSAAATETLIDLVERFGLADMVIDRVKGRIEEIDMDELFDDVTDYLRRNPEVLVVTLGAVTVATGLVVWLSERRQWDGNERRGSGQRYTRASAKARKAS